MSHCSQVITKWKARFDFDLVGRGLGWTMEKDSRWSVIRSFCQLARLAVPIIVDSIQSWRRIAFLASCMSCVWHHQVTDRRNSVMYTKKVGFMCQQFFGAPYMIFWNCWTWFCVNETSLDTWEPRKDRVKQSIWSQIYSTQLWCCLRIGNVTGYPGVFQSNPCPYPSKPVPASTGTGFRGYR